MARIIKRYGSRKLYDTSESRYISLDDIANWIREGLDIQVLDNASGEDVTAQTLTQVISEEGRKGATRLPNELLHDIIRAGGNAVNRGVQQIQSSVDTVMKRSIDRLIPVRMVRDEMTALRDRLELLEASLSEVESQKENEAQAAAEVPVETPVEAAVKKPAARRKPAASKTAAAKPKAKRTTRAKTTAKPSESKKPAAE